MLYLLQKYRSRLTSAWVLGPSCAMLRRGGWLAGQDFGGQSQLRCLKKKKNCLDTSSQAWPDGDAGTISGNCFHAHHTDVCSGRIPEPRTREFLHGFPLDYSEPASPRSRCRMLGNSWRLPTCRFLLFTLLVLHQDLQVTAIEGTQWYPPVSCPRFEARFHPDGSRPILRARSWWLRAKMQWDPNEPLGVDLKGPDDSAERRARWALALTWCVRCKKTSKSGCRWPLNMFNKCTSRAQKNVSSSSSRLPSCCSSFSSLNGSSLCARCSMGPACWAR